MAASESPPVGSDATLLARPGERPVSSPSELSCSLCGSSFPSTYRVCPNDGTPLAGGTADPDPLIGAVLGGAYRIVSLLGEGGMGMVYEAEHLRLDRRYAVKVIHRNFASHSDLLARFDREARAMSRVHSDHVVDVVDVLRTPDGRPCIVAEKLVGEDLEDHLRSRGKLPLERAVPLFLEVCRGLSAAHAQGIVHRDLKPSNLFLAKDASGAVTLKILDFGVAKIGGDAELTGTGAIVGTPAFMSPEQARGSSDVDVRSDVYSAGAVLYRMLTGRPPYGNADASVTLIKLLEESPTRARTIDKSIPAAVEAILEKAMARDPSDRHQSVAELAAEVAMFEPRGARVAGSAEHTEVLEKARAMGRRAQLARPVAVGAMVALAATCGLSVGVFLALLVDGLRTGAQIQNAELFLVILGALVSLAAASVFAVRALRTHWRSGASVEQLTGRVVSALSAFLLAFGIIELGARGWAVIGLQQPGAWDPIWAAARLLSAIGIGAMFVALGRRR